MKCPKCGNLLNDNDKVCNFCGAPVVQPKPNAYQQQPPIQNAPIVMKKQKKNKLIKYGIATLIIAVIAFLIYFFIIRDIKNADYSQGFDPVQIPQPTEENKQDTPTQNDEAQTVSIELYDDDENGENDGTFSFTLPAGYKIYSNQTSFIDTLNTSLKIDLAIYTPIQVNYYALKAAKDYTTQLLYDRGYAIDETSDKTYNNREYYIFYCTNKKYPYYLIYTAYNDNYTLSFSVENIGNISKEQVLVALDAIISSGAIYLK